MEKEIIWAKGDLIVYKQKGENYWHPYARILETKDGDLISRQRFAKGSMESWVMTCLKRKIRSNQKKIERLSNEIERCNKSIVDTNELIVRLGDKGKILKSCQLDN